MNKAEYLKELDKRLKYIPQEDREDAIEYYTELISDMGFEDNEDVTVRLGSARDAAKKILAECTQKHVDAYEENKTVKGSATVVWLTILGVLSLPVSLPLAIVVLALAFSVIAVILSLIIALAATAVGLVIGGIGSLVVMWAAPGVAQKAVVLGMGLCSLALGVLLAFGIFFLVRMMVRRIFRRKSVRTEETV